MPTCLNSTGPAQEEAKMSLRQAMTWLLLGVPMMLAAPLNSQDVAAAQPADLIVTHAYVVTMNGSKDIYEDGAVVINRGRILAVGPVTITTRYRATKTIDAAGDIVMPGMINTHTHASMTAFRGLGDDVPDRLQRFIFPLEHKLVDREIVYWGALHGMVEMIQGGVTTMADMYYFEDEVARAAQKIGMRSILGETILNAPAPDSKEPYGGISYALEFIQQFHGDPIITPAFAPHAPYTVDAEHLRIIQKEADAQDVPILMHVAEMPDEVANSKKNFNKTPVEYLDSIGLLSKRLVAAHCIFVTDSDIALLKARDVGVAHNMVANIKSAKGVAPAWKMFNEAVRVGLGTDGPMSGNTLDIIGQLGYVAKVQKLANRDRNIMPALDVVEMATMGGARALHMEDRVGSLDVGKFADMIVLDHDSTTMTPFYDVYSTLVYAASAHDVSTTIIQGRVIMENRRIRTVDVADVREHMRGLSRNITQAVAHGIK
jgi:cytosine/adenosine deaminase-related metal-dependent hydrolase